MPSSEQQKRSLAVEARNAFITAAPVAKELIPI
jgi:hypothetical protein